MPGAVLHRLLNASPHAVLLVDERTIIRAANDRVAEQLCRSTGALRGRSLLEFVEGDPEAVLRFLRRCSGSGSALPGPLTLATQYGPATLVAHGAGLRLGDEAFILLHCTEGQRASVVFRRLEERLQALHRELHQERRLHLELQQALHERETLLHEIHHRVRNNLQVITSFLNLQMREHGAGEGREALRNAQARIQALALVHNQLYSQDGIDRIDMAVLLPNLCHHLAAIYEVADRVTFAASLPTWPLDVGRASPLALLVTEAATNALKHAFPDQRAGTISLTVATVQGEWQLTIADDGVGLPETTPGRERQSVGWQLMRALATQLAARLEIRTTNGVEVTVTLPEELASPVAA